MIVFRVGAIDAEVLEKEFAPQFTAEDIVNLGKYQIYLRLMIDGMGSQPFSATTLPPIAPPAVSYASQVIESSRSQFGHARALVEEQVRSQTESTPEPEKRPKHIPPAPSQTQTQAKVSAPVQTSAAKQHDVPKGPVQKAQHLQQRQHQRPIERPATPPDESGGFHSIKNLKIERKGITPESKDDLRKALAAIVAPTPAPKQKPPSNPPPAPHQKPPSGKEVPEEVLKKILEM